MKTPWEKLACALLAILVCLGGWGLKKVYDVDLRVARVEERIVIWHTQVGTLDGPSATMLTGAYAEDLSQALRFLQLAAIRAWGQLERRDVEGAKKTLLVGLQESGRNCYPAKGGLECEP